MLERKHIEALLREYRRYDYPATEGEGRLAERVEDAFDAAFAAADESPWRSMDSAPKDGRDVLLWCPNGMTPSTHVGYWDDGVELWMVGDDDIWPTHWMPLPAAPEVDE